MSSQLTKSVIGDVLAEVDGLQTSLVLKAAAREIVRQLGQEKVKEIARRVASAYIDDCGLPLGGAVVKQVALPAAEKFVSDALVALGT